MGIPQVVIVGRPNVGKSSLFNWLAGKRLAIVDDKAGVTRDRLSHLLCFDERYFEIVDTGGMGHKDVDNLTKQVDQQIEAAIDSADVILFVVDTRMGLVPMDKEIAQKLRYVNVPVICVANKTDSSTMDTSADEFYRLGRGKLVRVSALQNRGKDDLFEAILEKLPRITPESPIPHAEPTMKVAIVGRRNTGKSTFVNTLAQAERVIVSEVPGTTRDSIDVRFELDGKTLLAIDTPGLQRRKSVSTDLDFYSMHRAQRSIRRADVVLMFFDAAQTISKIDKQLCDYVTENYKPCIFVVNKWDLLVKSIPTERWVAYLHDTFRMMHYAPIAFITGQTGKNVKALLNHAQMLYKQSRTRITTGELNRAVRAALEKNPPPMYKQHLPKIYYATQVGTQPPTIVLFCNHVRGFTATYQRYLLSALRDSLPFDEIPIKLYLRKSDRYEKGHVKPADLEQEAQNLASDNRFQDLDVDVYDPQTGYPGDE